ncbi:MAG: putative lipid II flippase FtsW [Proteobacteria bacterium]|uniref:Probable peptidoglycan glycosyltransferase FtsW n=1 Tax=Candidatus Avisuccinivibrio stercorigallinarum TaxID=2840704 RepID=A0A9D9GSQ8_9GAMM|nr:putative lipid II flippase FtsW [Candidatus Avisuccinivibrio stercorigallinarum]
MLGAVQHFFLGDRPVFDRKLILAVLALLIISIVLISSASVMEAFTRYGDSTHYLKRQLVYTVAGLAVFIFTAAIPVRVLQRISTYFLFFSLFLLVVVLFVGREINEAKRWIEFGFFNVQPAELLKLSWVLYLSSYAQRRIAEIRTQRKGFYKPLAFICVIAVMLLLQPDFGSFVVVTAITFGILFVAGAGLLKYILTGFVVSVIGGLLIWQQPYRMERVMSFRNPWLDEFGSGYQLTQSLMAFGRGGMTGQGLGNSIQKLGYLPEAHTDFVTAILGEEFGFAGMMVVLCLEFFIVLKAVLLGMAILRRGPDFKGFAAFGIGLWFCLQTVINIGAASGALPTKGLTLPLISYGGSSLMLSMAAVAIVLRIDFEWRSSNNAGAP